MVAWAQQGSYRCSTNMHDAQRCRCNRTRHDILEELVYLWLDQTEQSLDFLFHTPDDCVRELDARSEPLIREYTRLVVQMWRKAKEAGHEPPVKDKHDHAVWTYAKLRDLYKPAAKEQVAALQKQIRAKEQEKERLARRLGLIEDDGAAAVIAARIKEVAKELRELREQDRPALDRAEVLREQIKCLLDQTRRVRSEMETALPLMKGEYIRSLVREIRVTHQERRMGKLRASRLVAVKIVPAIGTGRTYQDGKDFDADHKDGPSDEHGGPQQWRLCRTVVPADLCEEGSPGPG